MRKIRGLVLSGTMVGALASAGCSTTATEVCPNLTGRFVPASSCIQTGSGKKSRVSILPDGSLFSTMKQVVIRQTGCSSLTMQIHSDEGEKEVTLEPGSDGVSWTETALTREWHPDGKGLVLLPSTARKSRSWRLRMAVTGGGLVYSDRADEYGMALLLIPFHDVSEVECALQRIPELVPPPPATLR